MKSTVVLLVFCWIQLGSSTPLFQFSSVKNHSTTTVQTCSDVIQFYQQGYELPVYDCLVEAESKSLYWRVDFQQSWSQARGNCQLVTNGDLAVVKTTAQRAVALNLINLKVIKAPTWLGFQYQTGAVQYVDGSTVDSYIYNNNPWFSTSNGNCGCVDYNWANLDGSSSQNYNMLGFWFQLSDCNNSPFVSICQTTYS